MHKCYADLPLKSFPTQGLNAITIKSLLESLKDLRGDETFWSNVKKPIFCKQNNARTLHSFPVGITESE